MCHSISWNPIWCNSEFTCGKRADWLSTEEKKKKKKKKRILFDHPTHRVIFLLSHISTHDFILRTIHLSFGDDQSFSTVRCLMQCSSKSLSFFSCLRRFDRRGREKMRERRGVISFSLHQINLNWLFSSIPKALRSEWNRVILFVCISVTSVVGCQ